MNDTLEYKYAAYTCGNHGEIQYVTISVDKQLSEKSVYRSHKNTDTYHHDHRDAYNLADYISRVNGVIYSSFNTVNPSELIHVNGNNITARIFAFDKKWQRRIVYTIVKRLARQFKCNHIRRVK